MNLTGKTGLDFWVASSHRAGWLAIALLVAGSVGVFGISSVQADEAAKEEPMVEQGAIDALVEMSKYLRTLKTYFIEATTTDEDVFEDGQKAQYGGTAKLLVNLPGQLRLETENDLRSRLFLFDGETFTLVARKVNYYAQVDAPPTVGELVAILQSEFGISMPLVDLFYWSEPDWKPDAITGASDLGPALIDGVVCQHYAFRQEAIDLWTGTDLPGELPGGRPDVYRCRPRP